MHACSGRDRSTAIGDHILKTDRFISQLNSSKQSPSLTYGRDYLILPFLSPSLKLLLDTSIASQPASQPARVSQSVSQSSSFLCIPPGIDIFQCHVYVRTYVHDLSLQCVIDAGGMAAINQPAGLRFCIVL